MNILRFTRHPVTEKQQAELIRIFGNPCDIINISRTIPSAAYIIDLINTYGAGAMEVVALPLPLLAELMYLLSQSTTLKHHCTIMVFRAVMQRTISDDGSVTFEFDYYERIRNVVVETERL